MTDSSEPSSDGLPPEATPQPDSTPVLSEGSSTESDLPNPEQKAATPIAVDEGLPEWEPLTPELVEDEAIRGDFVIRWVVVGLALLFGFSQIRETRTLVHIRTGEYLATYGIIPPAKDVFSYTASDRSWINLSWLFDLFAAGVHAVSGGIGLSIVQGCLAGVVFGLLVHTYRPGIRTWWGSICAVLTLLVCYSQLTMQPELITMVGLALVLWIIVQAEDAAKTRLLWFTIPVVWIWAQLDSRAYLGWFLLLSMAIGERLRRSDDAKARFKIWIQVAVISMAITMLHPFLWQTLTSPVRMFLSEYPALRRMFPRPMDHEVGFFGINSVLYWSSINHDAIAALTLSCATIVAMFLNRERLHPGHLIAAVVFFSLSCLATREFAAASLVNCVICTINAQTWYRHRFGQIYSIDWRELLFSRGGRALTVFCFFGLAWLVISGRIDGPHGKRTGLGFDKNLLVQMNSYVQVADDEFDDRPFHFTARQGDLLIWSGQKSFLDTRGGLFWGTGDFDLISLHNRTRNALRESAKENAKVWQDTFTKFQITHVMPRLSGPVPTPDYVTLDKMLATDDWVLTRLVASTAVLYRNEDSGPLREFVTGHRLDLVKQGFQTPLKASEELREWPKAATLSENVLSLRQQTSPAPIQEAGHYVHLAFSNPRWSTDTCVACLLHAIRQANAGLREDANSATGYRQLGLAYLELDRIESEIVAKGKNAPFFNRSRYYQIVSALQQAALLQPNDSVIRLNMLRLFERLQRSELSLESLRKFQELQPLSAKATEEQIKQRDQLSDIQMSLEEVMDRIDGQIDQQLQAGTDRFQIAAAVYQAGAVLRAIKLLQEDAIYTEQNLAAKSALGGWLIEAGRVQEGYEILEVIEQVSASAGAAGLKESVATSALTRGDYPRAIRLWDEQIDDLLSSGVTAVLLTMPFQAINPLSDQYPLPQLASTRELFGNGINQVSALRYQLAIAQLEMGDIDAAAESLGKIRESDSNPQLVALLKFYRTRLPAVPGKSEPKSEPANVEEFELIENDVSAKDEPSNKKP